MSALLTRIKRFAHSPQGRSAAASVRRAAADPRRRTQVQRLLTKLREEQRHLAGCRVQAVGDRRQDRVDEADAHEGD
ncbi:hypothetical protein ABZY16_36720, partial [Streptomyces sp. NPDC006553]|uniref:hypothetical protein n=1 Tax=Streptomyces sp. NPDC006553 TaxID=3157180 RepID=UPI0033ADE660